jgi:NADH:ubiquinone oxidoreductase subunit 2 (subunit N)
LKRIIKYLVNLTCIGFQIFLIRVSFATIVRVSSLERIFEIIWSQAESFAFSSIVFLLILTYLNFVFERKIEKRKTSREFIIISLMNLAILPLAFAYFSWNFHHVYVSHPEYFR